MNKNNSEQLNCPAGSKNQLSTCGFSYDAAGNLTETGLNVSYVFDAENRIIATSGLSYIYDGDGNRVEKCTEGGLTRPMLHRSDWHTVLERHRRQGLG